jgi:type IV pilus assembly protein PilB
LVEAGVLTQETLETALQIQKKRQLRLGTILLQEGFVSESQLVQALSLKLSIPWVSLWRIDIPDELLDLVPANVAEEFFLMPIYIRTTKEGERALYVAMNDPTDEDALKFVSASAGFPVKPMIAGPSDLASAIRAYYYGEDDEWDEAPAAPLAPPPSTNRPSGATPPPPPSHPGAGEPPAAPPVPVAEAKPEEIEELQDDSVEEDAVEEDAAPSPEEAHEPPAAEEPPAPEKKAVQAPPVPPQPPDARPAGALPPPPPPSAAAQAEDDKVFASKMEAQREAERRIYGVGGNKPTRGFSLTLLDGTTLSFGPGKKKQSAAVAAAAGKLNKDDLISGLKAAARGTPLDDFLPSDKWEAYMAAILRVLFNKHLVFYEEFIKELEDISKK